MSKLEKGQFRIGGNRNIYVLRPRSSPNRHAFSYAEVLVCATMLTTIISLVTVSSFRISRVWKDVYQRKVAINELSNQLDRLTALPVEQVQDLIDDLQPSDECIESLIRPKLSGTVHKQTDFGHRLTIAMTWQNQSGQIGRPVQLSAWWPDSADREGRNE
jgi:hypothetical protein